MYATHQCVEEFLDRPCNSLPTMVEYKAFLYLLLSFDFPSVCFLRSCFPTTHRSCILPSFFLSFSCSLSSFLHHCCNSVLLVTFLFHEMHSRKTTPGGVPRCPLHSLLPSNFPPFSSTKERKKEKKEKKERDAS